MKPYLRHPATMVWVVLMMATCLTGWLAGNERGIHWATVTILLIAAVKIGLIMYEFMELKSAPLPWKIVMGAWLVLVTCIVLSGGFLRPAG